MNGSRPSKNRADSGHEFPAAERLCQIVVSAHLETEDTIKFVAFRGEHDNWYISRGSEIATKGEPVLSWQHEIENDKVDAAFDELPTHLSSIRCCADAISFFGEQPGDQISNILMVINH